MDVTFFGVRGSCPCAGEEFGRFGGNTSCLLVDVPGDPPLILDLGTGTLPLGRSLLDGAGEEQPIHASALLTHLHYDHVLGLPFFTPLTTAGARLDVYGPRQAEGSLGQILSSAVRPPFFPIHLTELKGDIGFYDLGSEDFALGSAKVRARPVPHPGTTLGFRIESGGGVIAYVPDHQAPEDRQHVDPGVLELCDGADLLVHDAQYTEPEFRGRQDWGHSTVEYAVRVAAESGVRRLALFHHDPSHVDRDIESMLTGSRGLAEVSRLDELVAAAEGTTLRVGSG